MMLRADQIGRMTALPKAVNDNHVQCDSLAVGSPRVYRAGSCTLDASRLPSRPSRSARSAPHRAGRTEGSALAGWLVQPAFSWACASLDATRVAATPWRVCEAALLWGELGLASAAGFTRLAASGLELAQTVIGGLFSALLAPLPFSARNEVPAAPAIGRL